MDIYLNEKCDRCDFECEHKDLNELILVSDIKNLCAKCDFRGSRSCEECGKHLVDGSKLVDHI